METRTTGPTTSAHIDTAHHRHCTCVCVSVYTAVNSEQSKLHRRRKKKKIQNGCFFANTQLISTWFEPSVTQVFLVRVIVWVYVCALCLLWLLAAPLTTRWCKTFSPFQLVTDLHRKFNATKEGTTFDYSVPRSTLIHTHFPSIHSFRQAPEKVRKKNIPKITPFIFERGRLFDSTSLSQFRNNLNK